MWANLYSDSDTCSFTSLWACNLFEKGNHSQKPCNNLLFLFKIFYFPSCIRSHSIGCQYQLIYIGPFWLVHNIKWSAYHRNITFYFGTKLHLHFPAKMRGNKRGTISGLNDAYYTTHIFFKVCFEQSSHSIHVRVDKYYTIYLLFTVGGSRGRAWCVPPLRVQILSFWHTKFSKCSRLGSPCPPTRSRPPYGKS